MAHIDLWTAGAFLSAMALLATLRLSSIAWGERKLTGPALYLFSPVWLTPWIFVLAWTIGLMITGAVSTWPPRALEQGHALGGYWAGVTVFLMVIIAELWLLWTGATIALRYAPPEQRGQIKHLHLLAIILAGGFLYWMWTLHH